MMYRANPIKRSLHFAFLVALCAPLMGSKTPSILEQVKQQGYLQILSRNGPTTFHEGPHGLAGFEYTLAKAFADELGVKLFIRNEDNLGVMLNVVGTEQGDIAAAGLTITPKRQKQVRFSHPYLEVTQQVLYHSRHQRPESLADLADGELVVVANSSHVERLRELREEYPTLRWRARAGVEMLDLMEMVHQGDVAYAIVDSNAYAVNRNIFPRAKAAFAISEPEQLAWAFPKRRDSSLYDAAQDFFAKLEASGQLTAIQKQHFDPGNQMNRGGALLFANRVETRLPRWKEHLQAAATANQLDWKLLAALSYQESHWNAQALSPTGVRGLMMLTQTTAKEVGISNRMDPSQSITGGAKYFKAIFDRIPEQIQGTDRTWMALAAYNVGMGHLEDARILTQQSGDNPNKWTDVKRYLPLLAKRKYYQNTRFGYARGWEPVSYVENIRHFYSILSWHNLLETRRTAEATAETELQAVASPAASEGISLAL